MRYLATIREGNFKPEIISQTEIMFRLMNRPNRPQDLADLEHGKTVHTDYSDYKKISDFDNTPNMEVE